MAIRIMAVDCKLMKPISCAYLGPAFERAQLQTQIWLLDHNYN